MIVQYWNEVSTCCFLSSSLLVNARVKKLDFIYFLLSLEGLFSHGEIRSFMLTVFLLYAFFFQLCIRIVSPLYNLNVMKCEGEIVWVTCVVSEDVVCLRALILDMTYLEETEEGSSLCPVPDGHPSWNLLLLPGAPLSRVYFQY